MSDNLPEIPLPFDVLGGLVALVLRYSDAPENIRNEAVALKDSAAWATDLRRKRIQMQSSVQMPGNEAHPMLLRLFRFEKSVWQQLFIINDALRPYLKPLERDLESLVEKKKPSWKKTSRGRAVEYSLFEAAGAGGRQNEMDKLKTVANEMLKELKAYQAI